MLFDRLITNDRITVPREGLTAMKDFKKKEINRKGCMFGLEDIDKSPNKLKKMLIRILVANNITFDVFTKRHQEYELSVGTMPRQIASSRNNLLKVISCEHTALTYSRFEHIVKNVLRLNLVGMSLTFKDANNQTQVITDDSMTY